MNRYPAWIHRIPRMLETLAKAPGSSFDRLAIERLFGLRRTAAQDLLRRLGAELRGHSLVVGRSQLTARLSALAQDPDLRWEVGRRDRLLEALRRARRRPTLLRVAAEDLRRLDELTLAGLPSSLHLDHGRLNVECRDLEDLLGQLMQLLQLGGPGFRRCVAKDWPSIALESTGTDSANRGVSFGRLGAS